MLGGFEVALGLAQVLGDLVVVLGLVHALEGFVAALGLALVLEDSEVGLEGLKVVGHLGICAGTYLQIKG